MLLSSSRLWLLLNFNSIKVRLELTPQATPNVTPEFQFHKGTIRTQNTSKDKGKEKNFNSIKVRLELSCFQ